MAKKSPLFFMLLALLIVTCTLALMSGPAETGFSDLVALFFSGSDQSNAIGGILRDIRLPRVLMALIVGASLSVSGAIMQGLFRNPLADPGLIGVSGGAALGAAVAIVFGTVIFDSVPAWLVSGSAFVFGLGVTFLVYLISRFRMAANASTLLLAGVAIQSLATAGLGLLSYLASNSQLRDLVFWGMGSFSGMDWQVFTLSICLLGPALLISLTLSKGLNAILLGEEQARYLGVSVDNTRRYSIVIVALLTGVSVASVGIIAFVGLLVPHIARMFFGSNHLYLIPASALSGALLMVLADSAARLLVSPVELPIGILTAFIGCPFFLFLVLRQRSILV